MAEKIKVPSIEKKVDYFNICEMDARDIKRLVGENLKRIMREKRLSVTDVAEMVDSSQGYISKIRNGGGIGDKMLARISSALKVPPSEFFRPIPSIGTINEDVEEYQILDFGPGATSHVVKDDSMSPRYNEGDTVYASKYMPAKSGDVALVELPDGSRVVRKIVITEDTLFLVPNKGSMIESLPHPKHLKAWRIVAIRES